MSVQAMYVMLSVKCAGPMLISDIDVPFCSAHMRSWISGFRQYFQKGIKPGEIRPEQLVGHFVPNVMGKPLSSMAPLYRRLLIL